MDDAEVEWCGDPLIYVVDRTAAGFAYGPTVAELRRCAMRDAHAWACEHLPPAEPSTLLHGDLRGQNVLLAPGGPPHVIDWEYARSGDPAYDLAIVTRGVKQPFQIDRGLERLLEAYRGHGGRDITADDVTCTSCA